jgi:glycosyltransferase involved in cell wall biosynthesis
MRVLIIDPALRSMGGHHYNALLRLQTEFARLEIATRSLVSAYADRRVCEVLGGRPTFTQSVYSRHYAGPAEIAQNVAETEGQLHRARRWQPRPDLIVLPCCDQVLASALATNLGRTPRASSPRILLWLLYSPHFHKAPDDPAAEEACGESRRALAALAASVDDPRKLSIFCETPALAGFYRQQTRLPVEVAPGPGPSAARRTAGGAPRRPPTVACVGFANRAKGYTLLPEAIGQAMKRHPEARFLIHGVVKGSDAEGDQGAFDRLATLGERVVVRQDVLTPDEYLAVLAEADLLLLPYDPHTYHSRGSGVFTEARTIGIPIVATRECGFAQPAFSAGWGVAMESYDSRGLAAAISRALDRLDDLTVHAAVSAGQASDGLGGLLEGVVEEIRSRRSSGWAGILRQIRVRSA